MKLHSSLTIATLLLTTSLIYSQKVERLDEVNEQTFANSPFQTPIILSYSTIVTYPYKQDNGKAGAKDEYFDLRIESLVRIRINSTDSVKQLLGLSNTFNSDLKINSIKYYFLDGNTIGFRKIKDQDLAILSNNTGQYIDYSKIVQDSCVILDINFKSDPKSKKNIVFNLDDNIKYADFNLQVYMPEIYFYDILVPSQCIKTEIKRDQIGPKIGYKSKTGPSGSLLPQGLADQFGELFNTKFDPVYCKINLFSFTKINKCDIITDSNKELINLKLKNSTEIK